MTVRTHQTDVRREAGFAKPAIILMLALLGVPGVRSLTTGPENQAKNLAPLRGVDDGTRASLDSLFQESSAWALGTVQAAVYAAGGLRKNSAVAMSTGYDACGQGDPVAGLKTRYLQYQGDPTEVFDGVPPVEIVAGDPIAELRATGINWEEILRSDFAYSIADQAEFPDFSTLAAGYYPSIRITGHRIDLSKDHNGRGLLIVPEALRLSAGFEWDGVILVGDFFQFNGPLNIRGAMISGLNLLLGVPVGDITISTVGPGAAQVTYDTCMIAKARNADAGGASGEPLKAPGS